MVCSSCGGENRAGAKFCSECGTPLALAYPSCGLSVAAGTDGFCSECGHAPHTAPSQPAAATSTDQERRFVSVPFIDLVEFIPLTTDRDSEEVRSMPTLHFDWARQTAGPRASARQAARRRSA
ncbi:MAG TPA: zinc ribbon domain-containing protein [Actinobacteria bacterium]|nr:zinc ribbon domain-containing protein [Actinomycetota bacterium]